MTDQTLRSMERLDEGAYDRALAAENRALMDRDALNASVVRLADAYLAALDAHDKREADVCLHVMRARVDEAKQADTAYRATRAAASAALDADLARHRVAT